MVLCSLRFINVLFTTHKRALYNSQTYSLLNFTTHKRALYSSQTYSLQLVNVLFTQTKRFDSSNQTSRIYVVTIFTHKKTGLLSFI